MWVGRAGGRLRFGRLSHTTVLPLSARPSGLVFSGLALGHASSGCPGCARVAAALFFFHWSPRLAPPCKAAPELAGTRAPLRELPSPKGRDPVADSW